jgi:RNA polymerase sigma-70 factor (ECF subfamily)
MLDGLDGLEYRHDLDEFRALYEPTRRFAAMIGGHDVEPDDLVQEAFARVLLVERSRIDDLGRYLRRIVANLAHNERRRLRRKASATARLGDDVATIDRYPSDLSDLLQIEPRVRCLLYLVDVEGEPIAIAADTVGMAQPSARMALTRARRRLKATLSVEAGR